MVEKTEYGATGLVAATFVQLNWEGQICLFFLFLCSNCSFQQADQNVLTLCQNWISADHPYMGGITIHGLRVLKVTRHYGMDLWENTQKHSFTQLTSPGGVLLNKTLRQAFKEFRDRFRHCTKVAVRPVRPE